MAQLRHIPENPEELRYRPRVYFAGHPEDHVSYFDEVVKQLQAFSQCAVYYYAPEDIVELDEQFYAQLDTMNLIVMPVTARLLRQPNWAMDVVFPYAQRFPKPILPLMMESGLEAEYEEKFGNIQFLDKCNEDPTALPFEEKLKRYLQSKLVNDEQIKKIQSAFDAYVFLSYRKKDRKYAQQLMRLLHQDPVCRDIAIWYDEFLTPGEDFNDTIMEALQKSKLFALVVTPNVLEKPNYVLDPEYKQASTQGKPILPVRMLQTDMAALRDCCPQIPDAIDPADEPAMTRAIIEAMKGIALRENDQDPVHNFFIGLAYLNGIDVEINHELAVELITGAAEAGLTEAMEKLVDMYETGDGVRRDYEKSNQWYEKIVDKARKAYEQGVENSAWEYFWRLDIYGIRLNHDLIAGESVYQKQYALAITEWNKNPSAVNAWLVVKSCNHIGKIWEQRKETDTAEKWYLEAISYSDTILHSDKAEMYKELIDSYVRLCYLCIPHDSRQMYDALRLRTRVFKNDDGICDELSRSYKAIASVFSKQYYDQLVALHDHIAHKTAEEEYRRILIYTCTELGKVCNYHFNYEEGLHWCQQAMKWAETIVGMSTHGVRAALAETYEVFADTSLSKCQYQNAVEYYTKAIAIRKSLVQTNSVQSSCDLARAFRALGRAYDKELKELDLRSMETYLMRCAESSYRTAKRKLAQDNEYQQMIVRSKLCREKAEEYYLESLGIYISFEDLEDSGIQEEIANTYYLLGFLIDNEAYMEKAIAILLTLKSRFPEVKRYGNNIETIQKNMHLIIKEEKSWFAKLMDRICRKKEENG